MLSKKININHIRKLIKGKRVLLRADFNVPVKEGKIKDATRIKTTVPTIKQLLEDGPQNIVLMSHLGRPDGKRVEKHTLQPVVPALEDYLGQKVTFLNDCVGDEVLNATKAGKGGQIFLLENLRFHLEEEGSRKEADGTKTKADKDKVKAFRKALTALGDIYVNDAFGTAHRAHSSIAGIDLPIRAAGLLLKKELDYFSVLENPQRPFLVVLGGAKVADKIQLIENLIEKVDEMIIGGAMAFTFLKELHGINIGNSLYDKEGAKIVQKVMQKAKEKGVKIHLPVDFIAGDKFDASSQTKEFNLKTGISDGWAGYDIGAETIKINSEVVKRAKTIVWNGPQGVFEIEKFRAGSVALLKDIMEATNHGATSIVGGGDSVALVQSVKGAEQKLSHVSTGGGASLELLEGKILPGLEYLTNKEDLDKILRTA